MLVSLLLLPLALASSVQVPIVSTAGSVAHSAASAALSASSSSTSTATSAMGSPSAVANGNGTSDGGDSTSDGGYPNVLKLQYKRTVIQPVTANGTNVTITGVNQGALDMFLGIPFGEPRK